MLILPEDTPNELIDFSGVTSLPINIEITERLTYGNVALGTYRHRPHNGTLIGTTQYAVLINEGAPFELEWRQEGSTDIQHTRIGTGDIQIHPGDRLVYKHWQRPSRMLFFAVDTEFMRHVFHDVFNGQCKEVTPHIGIRDPVIAGMATAWRDELRQHGAGGRVQAEALATTLVVHLLRTYGDANADIHLLSGGMNDARLKRVARYIEEHLAEDISLMVLAQVAELSIHHFKEVFKVETGKAPHQYLIERRVHHAKEMLLGTDMPIVQIALAVGFSGQSHLTFNFRKLTGTTPMKFRLAGKLGLIRRQSPR